MPISDGAPRRGAGSLADAEPAEDFAQQFIGAERAGDLAERVVREAQLFGERVERGVGLRGMGLRTREVFAGAAQRIDVACAR